MKFHNILEELLASKVKISLLKILFRYPEKKFSGRELALLSKASPSRTLEVLDLFLSNGLVNNINIGNTSVWNLNKQSILAGELTPLFSVEEKILKELKSKICKAFIKSTQVLKLVLFGSLSRGDEKANSDIDLFILVKTEKDKEKTADQIYKLNNDLIPKYRTIISEFIYSKEECERKKNNAIMKQIQKDGETILNRT